MHATLRHILSDLRSRDLSATPDRLPALANGLRTIAARAREAAAAKIERAIQ